MITEFQNTLRNEFLKETGREAYKILDDGFFKIPISNQGYSVWLEKKINDQELLCKNILKTVVDEREVVIKAFDDIRKEFEGRKWLMDGRGAYPYDDDRYKEEVRYIMNAFEGITANVWKNIKSKTYEYRNAVEKPLLEKIVELEKEIELLKKEKKNGTN